MLANLNVEFVTDEEGNALMETGGDDVEDALGSVGSLSSGLFNDERERSSLVEKAKLALLLSLFHGIHVDTSVEKVAVEISDEGTDITASIRTLRFLVGSLDPSNDILHRLVPLVEVGLVDGEALAVGRELHVLVGENKLSDRGIERKSIHTMTSRVHKHARRTIKHISSSNLLRTLEEVQTDTILGSGLGTTPDSENRSDRDVTSDVRASIQRIHSQSILSTEILGLERHISPKNGEMKQSLNDQRKKKIEKKWGQHLKGQGERREGGRSNHHGASSQRFRKARREGRNRAWMDDVNPELQTRGDSSFQP